VSIRDFSQTHEKNLNNAKLLNGSVASNLQQQTQTWGW